MNRTASDLETFGRIIGGLELLFDKELTDAAKDLYFASLQDLAIEQVERAAGEASKRCRFFPKPAELREFVEGTADDAASKAWHLLRLVFRKAGGWESVLFTDGAIATALEITFETWPLCAQTLHEITPEMTRAKQKEFETAYRRALRECKREPRYLRGTCELTNVNSVASWQNGIPNQKPDGSRFFSQRVWIQTPDGGHSVHAEFDFFTGSLVTPIPELLSRPAIRGIAPAPESRLLSAAAGETVDQEGTKKLIAELVSDLTEGMRMGSVKPTALTPEQVETRRQLLKRQFEVLEGGEGA